MFTAAACGAPSLLWTGGLVGATELLEPSKGLAIEYDFEATSLQVTADYVLGLLRNSEKLNEVGKHTKRRVFDSIQSCFAVDPPNGVD
jgi:hypothetical protein